MIQAIPYVVLQNYFVKTNVTCHGPIANTDIQRVSGCDIGSRRCHQTSQ